MAWRKAIRYRRFGYVSESESTIGVLQYLDMRANLKRFGARPKLNYRLGVDNGSIHEAQNGYEYGGPGRRDTILPLHSTVAFMATYARRKGLADGEQPIAASGLYNGVVSVLYIPAGAQKSERVRSPCVDFGRPLKVFNDRSPSPSAYAAPPPLYRSECRARRTGYP